MIAKHWKPLVFLFLFAVFLEGCAALGPEKPEAPVTECGNEYRGNSDRSYDLWAFAPVFYQNSDNTSSLQIGYYLSFAYKYMTATIYDQYDTSVYSYSFNKNLNSGCLNWYGTTRAPEIVSGKTNYGSSIAGGFYRVKFEVKCSGRSPYLIVFNEDTWIYLSRVSDNLTVSCDINQNNGGWDSHTYSADCTLMPNTYNTVSYTVVVSWAPAVTAAVTPFVKQAFNSGGHNHTIPAGTVTLVSASAGKNTYNYTPSAYGGRETLFFDVLYNGVHNVVGKQIELNGAKPDTFTSPDSFVKLWQDDEGYLSTGGTPTHLGPHTKNDAIHQDSDPIDMNHWGKAQFIGLISLMAKAYKYSYADQLHCNDISLPFGGYFHREPGIAPGSGPDEHGKGTCMDLSKDNLDKSLALGTKDKFLYDWWHARNQSKNEWNDDSFLDEDSEHYHISYSPK